MPSWSVGDRVKRIDSHGGCIDEAPLNGIFEVTRVELNHTTVRGNRGYSARLYHYRFELHSPQFNAKELAKLLREDLVMVDAIRTVARQKGYVDILEILDRRAKDYETDNLRRAADPRATDPCPSWL